MRGNTFTYISAVAVVWYLLMLVCYRSTFSRTVFGNDFKIEALQTPSVEFGGWKDLVGGDIDDEIDADIDDPNQKYSDDTQDEAVSRGADGYPFPLNYIAAASRSLLKLWKYPLFKDADKEWDVNSSLIPHSLFRSFKLHYVTEAVEEYLDRSLLVDPTLTSYYYDDEESRNIIKDECGEELLQAFDALIPGAYKSDLFRLCVLYTYGGYYTDISVSFLKPLQSFVPRNVSLVVPADPQLFSSNGVWQGLLGARKGHPLIKLAIKQAIENIDSCYYGETALDVTGPKMLGGVLAKYLGVEQLTTGFHNDLGVPGGQVLILNSKNMVDEHISKIFVFREDDPRTFLASVYFENMRQNFQRMGSSKLIHYSVYWSRHQIYNKNSNCSLANGYNRPIMKGHYLNDMFNARRNGFRVLNDTEVVRALKTGPMAAIRWNRMAQHKELRARYGRFRADLKSERKNKTVTLGRKKRIHYRVHALNRDPEKFVKEKFVSLDPDQPYHPAPALGSNTNTNTNT